MDIKVFINIVEILSSYQIQSFLIISCLYLFDGMVSIVQ